MLILTIKTMILLWFASKSYNLQKDKGEESSFHYPLVSILSPCYNEAATLANCIKGFANQTYPCLEVIIINDGSTDNTREVAQQLVAQYPTMVRLLDKENSGKAQSLNYGIHHAVGDIMICVDADSIFQKDTVEQLVAPFRDPTVAAVAGNVKISNTNTLITKNQLVEYITGQNLEKRTFSELNCIQVISGCVGAFRKDRVLEVGGYSSDTLVEDMDLTISLAKKGYRIVYNPRAVAYTEAPENLANFMKQRYRWCYGRYEVLKKHREMMFKKEYGPIGTVGLPYYLISPWLDVFTSVIVATSLIIALLTNNILLYAINFAIIAIPFILLILYIIHIDGVKGQRKLPIYAIVQGMYYSYLLNYINIKAGIDYKLGVKANWNKFERVGKNTLPVAS
jgi:peptidoglycan-N-acetylglucosamine deacetylase